MDDLIGLLKKKGGFAMILYHASNCIVDNPDVLHSRNFLDFGKGFYMTSLEEQARKYALRFLLNEDKAYLNIMILFREV